MNLLPHFTADSLATAIVTADSLATAIVTADSLATAIVTADSLATAIVTADSLATAIVTADSLATAIVTADSKAILLLILPWPRMRPDLGSLCYIALTPPYSDPWRVPQWFRPQTGIIFGLWDQGLAWYKGGVAGEMSSVTELRLQDFDISEDTGFVPSSPPLTSLPEYFTHWKLARTDQ